MSGTRRALIIANDRYDNPGLRRLASPSADAEALKTVLKDREVGAFDRVEIVANEPSHSIQSKVEDFFLEGRADDVVLLHFS